MRDHEPFHPLGQYNPSSLEDINVIIPNFANLDKPLVKVFTFDSAKCTASGCMTAVAQQAAESSQGAVEFIRRFKQLGFAHFLSMCNNCYQK